MAARQPLCYVADAHSGTRRTIAQVAASHGVNVVQFTTVAELLVAVLRTPPDLIFLDFGDMTAEGSRTLGALVTARVRCPVQIVSGLNPALVEGLRRDGERQGLRMLPIIYKPFRHVAISKVIGTLGLRRDALGAQRLKLQDVLDQNWLQIWYQPKIDLRSMKLTGAEAFARVVSPEHGTLPPECFIDGADATEMFKLTAFLLARSFEDWQGHLSAVHPGLRVSLNVPLHVLKRMPAAELGRETRSKVSHWPGYVFEVDEGEVVPELSEAKRLAADLTAHGMGLSIGNCGAAFAALSTLTEPGFTELKIDRSYVAECDLDSVNAGICETMIDLAHQLGAAAVAEGIEAPAELNRLKKMKCDFGQGYLFAKPMTASDFKDRFAKKKAPETALGSAA